MKTPIGHMQRLRKIGAQGEYEFMSSEETKGPTADPARTPNVMRKKADALVVLSGITTNLRLGRTFLIWILNQMRWSSVLPFERLIHHQRREIEDQPIWIVLVELMGRRGQTVSTPLKVWNRQMQGREWACDQF